MNGKGDRQRKSQVTERELAIRWSLTFGDLATPDRIRLTRELEGLRCTTQR